tara:strand:+ start:256 stop:636 length:381 start_codon:yes stop_codon:yes gene_type:complete
MSAGITSSWYTGEALQNLCPNAKFYVEQYNDDPPNIVWDGTNSDAQPSQSQIDEELIKVVAGMPMKLLRIERNSKLALTDWSQGDDVPVGIKTAYQTYRQALRDLPANQTPADNELSNITWPTKPS